MGLSKIKFNNEDMPFTATLDFGKGEVLTKNQTEGGHTIVQLIRKDILSLKVGTTCLYSQLQRYAYYSNLDSFTVSALDPLTNTVITRTVKMYNFAYSLLKDSQDLVDTTQKGVYKVSFTLEEF